MNTLKKEILELLDKDVEFRYAVAGYLGFSEILKRLDALAEEQVKIWREIEGLREEQARFRDEQVKIWREIEGLREEQARFRDEQVKIWREIEGLREEQVKLREDFNRAFNLLNRRLNMVDRRLNRVERTLEKLTVDVEDEARSIIKYRVKQEMGVEVEIGSLTLPDVELNVYGVSNALCIVGEATVRAGVNVIDELLRKVELLKAKYPEKVRGNIVPVIYACLPLPELIEEAKKKDVWLLKATQDFHKPKVFTSK